MPGKKKPKQRNKAHEGRNGPGLLVRKVQELVKEERKRSGRRFTVTRSRRR